MWTVGDELPPAMFELARSFVQRAQQIDDFDDVQFYDEIVYAVRLKYSMAEFTVQHAPELHDMVKRIEVRLDKGWFRQTCLKSPQARYASSARVNTGDIQNGVPNSVMQKPHGALWTSSFMPDGRSSWAKQEHASATDRPLYKISFATEDVHAYMLDTLDDFIELVDRYPSPDNTGSVAVAWKAMARDFDAVHITARGLLAIEGVEFHSRHGIGRLSGWDVESTAWLRIPSSMSISLVEPDC